MLKKISYENNFGVYEYNKKNELYKNE